MRASTVILALAVMAAPGPALAQVGTLQGGGPIERLLAYRTELNLSVDQIRRLEEIGVQMNEKDRPILGRIVELRGQPIGDPLLMRQMPPEQWQRLYDNMAELRPLMQQMRENHWQAISQAQTVLTPEQNAKVAELMTAGVGIAGPGMVGRMGRGGMGGGMMMRGGRGMAMQGGAIAGVGVGRGAMGGGWAAGWPAWSGRGAGCPWMWR